MVTQIDNHPNLPNIIPATKIRVSEYHKQALIYFKDPKLCLFQSLSFLYCQFVVTNAQVPKFFLGLFDATYHYWMHRLIGWSAQALIPWLKCSYRIPEPKCCSLTSLQPRIISKTLKVFTNFLRVNSDYFQMLHGLHRMEKKNWNFTLKGKILRFFQIEAYIPFYEQKLDFYKQKKSYTSFNEAYNLSRAKQQS